MSSARSSPSIGKSGQSTSTSKLASTLPFATSSTIDFHQSSSPKSAHQNTSNSKGLTTGLCTRTRPELLLPQNKVKLIMKTSPEIEQIGHDALYLITKSTELFIDYMASTAFKMSKSKTLEYKHLAELAQSDENMDFLKDIIPTKIPARIALQEMAKQNELMHQH